MRKNRILVVAASLSSVVFWQPSVLLAGPPPANDDCINAITLFDGFNGYLTTGATTDGPAHAGCEFDGQTYHDIWYEYTASCTGNLTVTTCDMATYDTDLVIYDGCDCGSLNLLGCEDDSPCLIPFTSELTVPVIQGNCYLVRIGGFGNGSMGSGTAFVDCVTVTDPGACCHANNTCTLETIPDCQAMGGTHQGGGSNCIASPCVLTVGPDVIYSDVPDINNYGELGGIRAYALGAITCNIGDTNLPWGGGTKPLLAMNAYRLHDGRLEQIGMSWVKNGFQALTENGCGPTCNGQGGAVLGAGCRDEHNGTFNGSQAILGPRSDVDPFTGAYPGTAGVPGDAIFKRLQIVSSDLTQGAAGAIYFVEGVYVSPEDASAGNALNNASYRRVSVDGAFNLVPEGATQPTSPAIQAWRDHGLGIDTPDPSVALAVADIPGEGRFHVAGKTTDLGGGQWRYAYAVFNLNSHRSAGSFSVPIASGTNVSNVSFHDVDYHSGEVYDNTDWTDTVSASSVTWSSPQTHAQNPNTNALRWGTMYSFSFEADVEPVTGNVTIGLFRPGVPASVSATVPVAGSCLGDCFVDGRHDGFDIPAFVACLTGFGSGCGCADMDGNSALTAADIPLFVTTILAGQGCP